MHCSLSNFTPLCFTRMLMQWESFSSGHGSISRLSPPCRCSMKAVETSDHLEAGDAVLAAGHALAAAVSGPDVDEGRVHVGHRRHVARAGVELLAVRPQLPHQLAVRPAPGHRHRHPHPSHRRHLGRACNIIQ